MSAPNQSLADSLGRIEALAAALGMSRIGVIALADSPSEAERIATAFAERAVTTAEARAMLIEARLTAPARARPHSRVPPAKARNG